MSSLFNFNAPPEHYAVLGNPITHSKSPRIHAMFAKQTGQRIVYSAIQVDHGGFQQAVGNFQASGGKGLNVTVPFKREAWELVNDRSARAQNAGAVNTIVMRADSILFGDNTDGAGLLRDLRGNFAAEISGQRVLILGAGGAVRGVLQPLLEEQPALLVIANRTADRAAALAQEFATLGPVTGCGFDALFRKQFDLVINGTSASLQGDLPPLPDDLLTPGALCYDLMYSAQHTVFMRWAEQHGAGQVEDGLGMLVEQAAEAFYIWRGVRPQTAPVITQLRAELAKTT
ncbi:MAG: shikimate dehydrogenase [Gammaproteobacteria bacterium]|nr:shikimate dehydrogenase [Gammaproteobacteria bacterium]